MSEHEIVDLTPTAEDFARSITNMRFGDVMKVVDAINTANGHGAPGKRGKAKVDGMTLLSAAQAILGKGSGNQSAPAPRTPKAAAE